MLYELRIYDIRPIAFWETVIGTSNTLTYILVWESLAERAQKWNAFTTDPEWQKIAAETTKDGPIVLKATNTIMRPTTYSALQ